MKTEYAGNRWYKCDLHLHTAASECYPDKEDTAKAWVQRAKDMGLSLVAVTDHNDYRGIRAVMEEGKKQDLLVLPGVEITCDSSKIHMLILFDLGKTEETVRDFLNRCDIDSEQIGKSEGTSLSVFEVCEIAKKRGALVIAAHIDEFNSISSMNPANLDKLLESGYIDAVQVTNTDYWRAYQRTKDENAMLAGLQKEYGEGATKEEVLRWRKCFQRAEEYKLPMLAFSDNPRSSEESKHGLWGIGSDYTWIQMDQEVSLSSIRQALITPKSRIFMRCDSVEAPKTEPDFWIRSLEIRKSTLNPHQPIHLDFHPQMNCIIGGRGSGKSSIIRILRGVYRRLPYKSLKGLPLVVDPMYSSGTKEDPGIFNAESEIEIHFVWYGIQYRMLVTEIKDADHQKYSFYAKADNDAEETWQDIGVLGFRTLMSAEVFAQHQVYEIAKTPGALLEAIDRTIPDMYILKRKSSYFKEKILNISMEMKIEESVMNEANRIQAERDWVALFLKTEKREENRQYYHNMEMLRKEALEIIASVEDDLEMHKKDREYYLKEYEHSLEDIRELRREFLQYVLKNDENYKMEIVPFGSRESFHAMMQKILKTNMDLIREDATVLESALFGKKDPFNKYAGLLNRARAFAPDNEECDKKGKGFSDYFLHLIQNLSDADFERMLLFHPEDEIQIFYHPQGIKRFFPMTNASTGEKASAILALILFNSTNPLIMDQPEDDMDNRVVYEEIVTKLKRAKKERQLIIATHNANITMNSDAEMVIIMEAKSKFTRVHRQGSLDSKEIRDEICDVLEGTQGAFSQRARKYQVD